MPAAFLSLAPLTLALQYRDTVHTFHANFLLYNVEYSGRGYLILLFGIKK
jgi:hypothetical protein